MKNFAKHLFGVLLCTSMLVGCAAVTIQPREMLRLKTPPTYESREDFFLWGLIGEKHVNVRQYCSGEEPRQMQAQTTLTDGLLTLITFGIYSPRSVRIWCE
jgi:hypothetical protein